MREKISIKGFTEAIRTSQNIHEFLLKSSYALMEHCKKIEFVFERDGKMLLIKKVGRKRFEESELNEVKTPPENYLSFELSDKPKVLLYTKPKAITSERKLKEIIEIISCGISVVRERETTKDTIFQKDISYDRTKNFLLKSAELIKEISLTDTFDDASFERITEKICEIFEASEAGIFIEQIGIKVSTPHGNRTLEKRLSEFLTELQEETFVVPDENLGLFPIKKGEKTIGVLGVKFEKEISKDLLEILERIAEFISLMIEKKEKSSAREKFALFDIFNKLNTAVAFYSKISPNKPIFSNEKFNKYMEDFPEINSVIEEEVLRASALNISSMKQIALGRKNLLVSVHPMYDGEEVILEITEKPEDKGMEKENIIKEFVNIFTNDIKSCEAMIKGIPKYSIERIKSKAKVVLSTLEDKEGNLKEILHELVSTGEVEIESNLPKDIQVPYNCTFGLLQLLISDLKISNQKTVKILSEDHDNSVLLRIPYRTDFQNMEEDMKFIIRYRPNNCTVKVDERQKEIIFEFSETQN